MTKTLVFGIACCVVGVLLFGFVGPQMYQDTALVAYFSAGTGILIGFGIALIVFRSAIKK
jgi:hypothetical protein